MNSENIISNNVVRSKNILKEELKGNEYTTIVKRQSRRRSPLKVEDIQAEPLVCPACGSTQFTIDHTRSEKSCSLCGVVVEENMIDSSIRGTSRDKDGNSYSQNGAPRDLAVHDGGLSTVFDPRKGRLNNRSKWFYLNRINNQTRILGSRERNLSRAFTELSLIVSKLSLSQTVRYESASIYRKAVKKDLVRGRSINKLIVATVYIACRECKVPRTLDEMAEVTDVDKKVIGKNSRFLLRELGLKLPLISPNDYVSRFASKLGLSSQAEVKSIEIINQAKELGLTSGKDPASITAASLYASSILLGERRTQTEIAKKLGVTEVTIRNRLKELDAKLNLL